MGSSISNTIFRILFSFILKIWTLILAVIFLLLLPLVLLVLLPTFFVREFVRIYSKHFRPDLGKMLTTFSTVLTMFDVYSPQPVFNLVASFVVSGKIEIDEFREAVNLKVINSISEDGESKYPELKQYVYNTLGFVFWKWEKNFDIKNHVHLEYQGDKVTKEMKEQLVYKLVNQPYTPDRSPWEIILVPNYVDSEYDDGPKSVIHLKYHHSMFDGFSLIKAIYNVVGDQEQLKILKEQTTATKPDSFIVSLVLKIWKLINMPFDFASIYVGISTCLKPFGEILPEYTKSQEFFYKHSSRIKSEYIRNIKNGHNVQFTSVLIAAVTAGVRKALELRNQPIPHYMYLAMPLAVPGHSDKLRNWATMCCVKLPVDETDSTKRLVKCNKNFLQSKRSTLPTVVFAIARAVGCVYQFILTFSANRSKTLGGVVLITFPGPSKQLGVGEHNLLSMNCMQSYAPGNMTLGFGLLTSMDHFQITVTCLKGGFYTEQSKLNEVLEATLHELDILHGSLT